MKRLLTFLQNVLNQSFCRHFDKELVALVRVPTSPQLFSRYQCNDCGREWNSADQPVRWLRNSD